MPRRPHLLALALIAVALVGARPASAYLIAQNLAGARGTANLVRSLVTVRVGAQWLDIEEEAEVEVTTTSSSAKGPWILEGDFTVPAGTAIVGCLLWNNDTLLMGKLRGKASAEAIFDSLVPDRDSSWARDPLLVEQLDATRYGLKLFPFQTSGTRRFRLRYLVPLPAGATELSIRPLASSFITGSLPAQFRLRLRGSTDGVMIVRGTTVWPAEFPSYSLVDLDGTTDVRLRWPKGPSGDGTYAIRGKIDSGSWKGEFAMFSGKVPDSILQKTALRSETVVLWRWISPADFFVACPDDATGELTARCLNEFGQRAVDQAGIIGDIASRSVQNFGKIGMIADEGMDDDPRVYPLGDSTTTDYRNLRLWLSSITESYLDWRIPRATTSTGTSTPSLEISKNRERFHTDVVEAATLYSAQAGVIRHLLVVTVGPTPVTGEFLQAPDVSALPADVSVSSSVLVAPGTASYIEGVYSPDPPPHAFWPGVDLAGVVQARSGGTKVIDWDGISLPRIRETVGGRVTMRTGDVRLSRDIVVRANGTGGFVTKLDVHAPKLGDAVTWSLFDENGDSLSSWDETPAWLRVDGDSALPRLWGKSEAPISPVFEDADFGPLFGYVDRFYSLLATPSDTLGHDRQVALVDSGVPFLSWREIFPRQGYKPDNGDPTRIQEQRAQRSSLQVRWLQSSRTLRVVLAGLAAQGVEIRDLRGRRLAQFGADQLSGRNFLDWSVPLEAGRGMLVVTVRTPTGLRSVRVLVN